MQLIKRLRQLLQSSPALRYFVSKPSNMSNSSVPFKSHVVDGALEALSRDSTRAQKLSSGLHPHGPAAFQARKESPPTSTQPEHRISVTDAGRSCFVSYLPSSEIITGVNYTVPVAIGKPAQIFNLLIDTGKIAYPLFILLAKWIFRKFKHVRNYRHNASK